MSDTDYSETWFKAMKNSANVRAQGRSTQPVPVKQPPATPLSPLKAPESGAIAYLHRPTTTGERARAVKKLCGNRELLIERICNTPKCLRQEGQLNYEWRQKVAAIEEMVASLELNNNSTAQMELQNGEDVRGRSPSRPRLQRSADSGAWWVGGHSTRGMVEGDIEHVALMDAEGDVEMELEGVL